MPDATINVGQCCTAKYEDEWHRARIISVKELVEVSVLTLASMMICIMMLWVSSIIS